MWLDNELSLFKQNIEILRVNQRIGRLAYLWAVFGLMVSKFLAYLIVGLLAVLIQGSSLQDSQYLSYIYFGCLQIMHVIATIFLLKRRLNDCGLSLWVGFIGSRIFMDVIMYMAIAVVLLVVQLGIPLYIPRWGFMVILIWPAIAMITLGIRRLHDSLLSGLWIIGLFIPYINIFVSYHLLFKKSWYIDD